MSVDNQEFVNSILHKLSKITYIKPGEVPNIDLYMDQVTTFMDEHLGDTKRYSDDKILTKTMINNYAKNHLLPPPVKKKYSKEHMLMLIFIYYFKNLLSISDIQSLLKPMTEHFFGNDSSVSLDFIYKEVYRNEKQQLVSIAKEISEMQRMSEETFPDVKDAEEREYLQLFAFVCSLSFDVYMKKHVIESIIDEMNFDFARNNNDKSEKSDKKKK